MRKFLINISLFSLLSGTSFYIILSRANGFTDPFYIRFTTPQQNSLILGTSRSAQAIQPKYLNTILTDKKIFNYSFTIAHSPYGPVYLSSVKKKLRPETKEGIFILSVDPWSIASKGPDPNDSTQFEELNLALSKTDFVNLDPNIPYLLSNYDEQFYRLFLQSDPVFLHEDGWLEVSPPMDSLSVKERFNEKLADYRDNYLPFYRFSYKRMTYLIRTIEFLKDHGDVFLVRLPVHPSVFELDHQLIPDFEDKMKQISVSQDVDYLDLTHLNSQMVYTDGNHIYKESGKVITEKIGKWILGIQSRQ